MSNYNVQRLDEVTYRINDSLHDTMYLVLGSDKALLIDCGMDQEPLRPLIESLTSLPVEVIFTHGHLDHVGTGNEFDKVYMSKKDHDVYLSNYKAKQLNYKDYDLIHDLDYDTFSLGDREIKIIELAGHTPGSILLADTAYKHVFTGDAIGSGCGVWMQVTFASAIDDYQKALILARDQLLSIGVDHSWTFLGGHYGQEYQSKVSSFNRLDLKLLEDMIVLCDQLLKDEADIEISNATKFLDTPYYASYQKAEMIFTLPQIDCHLIDLNKAKEAMNQYLKQFDINNNRIHLKMVHTYEVMKTSEYIARNENMNILDIRLASLIALLHDIGRFEQLRRFDSFNDSIIDHTTLGLEILFKGNKIRSFIEDDRYDRIIYFAIKNHSLYALQDDLDEKCLKHAKIIRDSDKLDNFRVKNIEMIETLFGISQEKFCNQMVSKNIINDIIEHRLIRKEDRNNELDMWVSYLAFVFDLYYNSSYTWLKDKNYVNLNIDRFDYKRSKLEMKLIKETLNRFLDSVG